ncbi:14565_t:CDS:2 [Funneliformis geosporum]|uniref:13118_t:CDS:1 n=1 Tax=Funneliformis geosporum TaxID=1117311 RepID=A0A9W4SGJ2_9GLOM|nr:14565_t:CDS:2 [Funneliformis geosporum]CAI2168099.1 13118_t:CDS:2 [Funneliformis geosporum]
MSKKPEQLINLYTHRIATADKSCFICNKFTTSVLRTDNGLDWFYTCESHLSDRGFASPVPEPEPEPTIDIQPTKIKGSQKEESANSKSDSEEVKDKSKESTKEGEEKEKEEKKEEKQQVATPKPLIKPQPPKPSKPKQYVLHRSIFYLRQDNLNKKRQKAEAQNLLSKLPSVPKTLQ